MITTLLRRHSGILNHSRLFEWIMAITMLNMGLLVGVNPGAVATGNFYLLEKVGLTPTIIFLLMFLFGTIRIVALIANGLSARLGPNMRAAGATIGGLMWSQMFLALSMKSIDTNTDLSLGIPVYISLTVGEIISCYRAATDARHK